MKKVIILCSVAVLMVAGAVLAPADGYPPEALLPDAAQYQAAAKANVEKYIEAKKWCGQPLRDAKSGQIVIYYTRDLDGKCTAKFTVGK